MCRASQAPRAAATSCAAAAHALQVKRGCENGTGPEAHRPNPCLMNADSFIRQFAHATHSFFNPCSL